MGVYRLPCWDNYSAVLFVLLFSIRCFMRLKKCPKLNRGMLFCLLIFLCRIFYFEIYIKFLGLFFKKKSYIFKYQFFRFDFHQFQ